MKKHNPYLAGIYLSILSAGLLATSDAEAVRIKELVQIRGVRSNPIVGYGLVVGLPGTGDTRRTLFTNQSLSSMLLQMGIKVDPKRIDVSNTAAVMITAEIPPFATPGERVDVMVSAIGDARNLASGTLVMTPLKGADGQVYAVAQGNLTVGGFGVDAPFARVMRNNPTTARIPLGASVEKAIPSSFVVDNNVVLTLLEKDFTTAGRIVDAVNATMQGEVARALNPGQIQIQVPAAAQASPVAFLAQIEAIDVTADIKARVVISERTGTVVVGGKVTLGPAAIAHGNLNVAILTQFGVSQPQPLSQKGETVVVPSVGVTVTEDEGDMKALPVTTTVEELVKALNELGASPRDLMAILQALKKAGSLNGELEVM